MLIGKCEIADRIGASPADAMKIRVRTEILFLRPDQLEPDPQQPRQEFDRDGLARLAVSMGKFSQLQPVLVRKEGTRFVLVTGERRWRAAKLAGMATIQCLVCKSGDVRSVQLVENLLREDLQPIEQAKAYYAMMIKEGWSVRELGRNIHVEHSRISKAFKLLKLPADVQKAIDEGKIPPTNAYEIAKRPKGEHRRLAKDVMSGKIKGDDLRAAAAATPPPPPAP
jgi:ParB family chromosome partitioning protein